MQMKHMACIGLLTALLAAPVALLLGTGEALAGGDHPSPMLRVGTFDSRVVALCYGRTWFLERAKTLHQDYDDAEKAGDQSRMAQLDSLGAALQEKLHQQVFWGAPIRGILKQMAGSLPGVAREAGVDLIATDVLYSGADVELVDISRQMVAPFHPDEATLSMVTQVLETPFPPVEE